MIKKSSPLSAEEIINRFGGIRPLAKKMGLTPSTVQGWKQRDSIPDNRLEQLTALAEDEGIDIYESAAEQQSGNETGNMAISSTTSQTVSGATPSPATAVHGNEKAVRYLESGNDIIIPDDRREDRNPNGRRSAKERRSGQDRRKGLDPNYKGPERRAGVQRRTGVDRRAFMDRRRRQVVWQTKWNFVERTIMTASVLYMLIATAFIFMMKPEYDSLQERAHRVAAIEKRLNDLGIALTDVQRGNAINSPSYAGLLHQKLEKLENRTDTISRTVGAIGKIGGATIGSRIERLESQYSSLNGLMDRIDSMTGSGKKENVNESVKNLQGVIQHMQGDVNRLDDAVADAREKNEELARLLQDVSRQDLGAAAMLLALGQFRESVGSGRPFKDDLQIIRDLVGNSPELSAAINKMAPYAESGILTPDALQSEFGDLATDIVAAGLSGEDLSISDLAAQRFSSLVTVTKDGERILTPNHPITNVVNTAHAQILKGDVRGAVQTLQNLEGPAGKAAEKWVQKARAALLAEDANMKISQDILRRLSNGSGGRAGSVSIDSMENFIDRNFLQPLGIPKGGKPLNLQWDPTKNPNQQTVIEFD
ncbi:MAG: hypothetical protein HND56_00340 [Pseudomonadota bacterium]|nr:hypothetical protein [Pseudomonadota bacterium]QKK04221.1 MAG: hypothetical protein HND56_00340 [Pseudomonadota bacterium]